MIRKRTIFIISSNYYKDISDKIEKEALEVIRENNMEYVFFI